MKQLEPLTVNTFLGVSLFQDFVCRKYMNILQLLLPLMLILIKNSYISASLLVRFRISEAMSENDSVANNTSDLQHIPKIKVWHAFETAL